MYYFKVLYLSHLGFRDQEIFWRGYVVQQDSVRRGVMVAVNVSDGPCVFEESYS